MNKKSDNDNIILNDEEKSLLLDHNYDGIEEFDYPLPHWWKVVFIITSVFGILYFYYYQVAGGPTLKEEFHSKMEDINKIREAYAKDSKNFDLSAYVAMKEQDPQHQNGFSVYDDNCMSCHEDKGKGDIGPNLTDAYWLNVEAVTPDKIYEFVRVGNEDNGMPAWADTLSKEELYSVVAYVLSLRNTNTPGGKAPQGVIIK